MTRYATTWIVLFLLVATTVLAVESDLGQGANGRGTGGLRNFTNITAQKFCLPNSATCIDSWSDVNSSTGSGSGANLSGLSSVDSYVVVTVNSNGSAANLSLNSTWTGAVYTNTTALQTFRDAVYVNTTALQTFRDAVYVNTTALQTFRNAVYTNVTTAQTDITALQTFRNAVYVNTTALQTGDVLSVNGTNGTTHTITVTLKNGTNFNTTIDDTNSATAGILLSNITSGLIGNCSVLGFYQMTGLLINSTGWYAQCTASATGLTAGSGVTIVNNTDGSYNVSSSTDLSGLYTNTTALQTFRDAVYVNTTALQTFRDAVYVNTTALQTFRNAVYTNVTTAQTDITALQTFRNAVYVNTTALQTFRDAVYVNVTQINATALTSYSLPGDCGLAGVYTLTGYIKNSSGWYANCTAMGRGVEANGQSGLTISLFNVNGTVNLSLSATVAGSGNYSYWNGSTFLTAADANTGSGTSNANASQLTHEGDSSLTVDVNFNNNSFYNSTLVLDAGRNGLPGVLFGSPVYNSSCGDLTPCLNFDGINDDVNLSIPSATISNVSDWTIMVDVFPQNSSFISGSRLFSFRTGNGASSALQFFGDTPTGSCAILWINNTGAAAEEQPNTVGPCMSLGVWNNIALVYNASASGNRTTLYVNGTKTTRTFSMTDFGVLSVPELHIGSRSGTSNFWNGSIDNFRIYARALGDNEISSLYQQKNKGGTPQINRNNPSQTIYGQLNLTKGIGLSEAGATITYSTTNFCDSASACGAKCAGNVTLVGGQANISTTCASPSALITVNRETETGVLGSYFGVSIKNSTGFTINATATELSAVFWDIRKVG